ncbi:MAG: restriction endonuclease [Betaproteobacteria bacterium]|nr:restriction endonuclease [Betaproteobacteria bacterium]
MPRNSLFAILLRSPWWISFAIAGALSLIAMALLPEAYRVVGALSSLPFVVIGVMAVRRQWSLPGAQEIESTARVLSSMTWQQFAPLALAALTEDGRVVREHRGPPADFIIHDAQGCRLVMAKRWKSARLGVDVLRELTEAFDAAGASAGVFIFLGEVTEPASRFATSSRIEIWGAAELAVRLRGKLPPV